MTNNEVNLILAQIESSTEFLATKEQVAGIDIKLDNHLESHKSTTLTAKKLGFVLAGAAAAAAVPLLMAFILS